MEQPNLIMIAELGFRNLKKEEKLWPFSTSTLRQRLVCVLQRLAFPYRQGDKPKPLTLASFRAGGATWLILHCESSEVVRCRGQWCSLGTMEVYTQEVWQRSDMVRRRGRWCSSRTMGIFIEEVMAETYTL